MQINLLLVLLLALFAQVYIIELNPRTTSEMAASQGLLNSRRADP